MMQQITTMGDVGRSIAGLIWRLEREGWSIGEDVICRADGRLTWVVSGFNGPNLIRAEGSSMAQAWAVALKQARSPAIAVDLPRPELPQLGGIVVTFDEGGDRGRPARRGDQPKPRHPSRARLRGKTHRDDRHARRANPYRQ